MMASDLISRFRSLIQWQGWVQVRPAEVPYSSGAVTSVHSKLEVDRQKRRTDNEIQSLKARHSPSGVPLRSRRASYLEPGVFGRGGSTSGVVRQVCIPRIDTGEAFGGLSGKKRRIYKVSLRVINTADIEVGVMGQKLEVVEGLKGTPKTGEFDVLLSSDADVDSELVIRQMKPSPFCLTSITAHLVVED